jgi:hypothetical protein
MSGSNHGRNGQPSVAAAPIAPPVLNQIVPYVPPLAAHVVFQQPQANPNAGLNNHALSILAIAQNAFDHGH